MLPLPYLTTALPGTGGVLRTAIEDFVVDEEPAYAAAGTGDHVFVRVEKRGLTTPAAVIAIARALGVAERDVGVAGMKDRHAITRQWISLPPPVTPEAALALALPDIAILEAVRHPHKLRTGHLRANRFALRVRDVHADGLARARAIFAVLAAAPGAPNYYGEQRFGRAGDNAARGRALVLGEQARNAKTRRLDRLMVSALQSELFNTWLAARITDGLYARALPGDVFHKVGGGMFDTTDAATDEPRIAAGEIIATGPMFGADMRAPADGTLAAEREAAILAGARLDRAAFTRVRAIAEGTRRDAAIALRDVTVSGDNGTTLELAFALPAGAYATTVMREVMKTDQTDAAETRVGDEAS